jgi:hypothetical protein
MPSEEIKKKYLQQFLKDIDDMEMHKSQKTKTKKSVIQIFEKLEKEDCWDESTKILLKLLDDVEKELEHGLNDNQQTS